MIHEALDILEQYVATRNSQSILDGVLALKDGSVKLQAVLDRIKALLKGEDAEEDGGEIDSGLASIGLDFGEAGNAGFVG